MVPHTRTHARTHAHTHTHTHTYTHTHTHTLSIYLSLRDYISYIGRQCSEILHADWKVFLSNTSTNLEDHLSQVIQLSGQCRVFVKSALCHTLLPYCDPFTVDEGRYSSLPMCPQSCVQLEERCGREIREFGAEFAKFLAARCDMLEVLATNQD